MSDMGSNRWTGPNTAHMRSRSGPKRGTWGTSGTSREVLPRTNGHAPFTTGARGCASRRTPASRSKSPTSPKSPEAIRYNEKGRPNLPYGVGAVAADGTIRRLLHVVNTHMMRTKHTIMPERLPTYLRTHRKKAGLSQHEVAHLVGMSNGSKVSRHERFVSVPQLETILAYELIFRTEARTLFAGVYEKVEANVIERARVLVGHVGQHKSTGITELKAATLEEILTEYEKRR